MKELELRKKLLIAEAEVYRQTLKLEIHNLRIYGVKTKRKMTSFRSGNPMLMLGVPMVASLLGGKRSSGLRRFGALGFLGWQLFRRFAPLQGRREVVRERERYRTTAAEEYLEKRM